MRPCDFPKKITWEEAAKKGLLDAREVAHLLSVHPETIRLWARKKKIESCKVGRLDRFEFNAVKKLVK